MNTLKRLALAAGAVLFATVVTVAAFKPSPVEAGSCDRDLTVSIAPYDTYDITFCSWGNPVLGADCLSGADADIYLLDADFNLVDSDELYDGNPRTSSYAEGWNIWHGTVKNCTGRWQRVRIWTR